MRTKPHGGRDRRGDKWSEKKHVLIRGVADTFAVELSSGCQSFDATGHVVCMFDQYGMYHPVKEVGKIARTSLFEVVRTAGAVVGDTIGRHEALGRNYHQMFHLCNKRAPPRMSLPCPPSRLAAFYPHPFRQHETFTLATMKTYGGGKHRLPGLLLVAQSESPARASCFTPEDVGTARSLSRLRRSLGGHDRGHYPRLVLRL